MNPSGTVDPAYWKGLVDTIKQHPDWRLAFFVIDPAEQTGNDTLSDTEVKAQLEAADQLASAGQVNAAPLVSWAAVEAALRSVAAKHQIELPDENAGTLITELYLDGFMDREDYDVLTAELTNRNAVAHGYRQEVGLEDVATLRKTIEHVLASNVREAAK